ncbi:PREDICTED: putative helicase mov-10-B.1 [Polistes dominula]|uniref:Helicase mov-10-B.1 n=1 Tax=Polistes dominula TaxID=743375 RepID=A0ABM1ICV5_POLDO|nr:PREDICTED: putative helicase mov-10-B.1 [Polistes dominula]
MFVIYILHFNCNYSSKFKFHENKKYDISVRDSNFPLKICHYALDEIQSFYNIKLLINPEIKKDTLQYYSITNFAWFNESIKKNPEQMQVVKNVINKTAYPAPYILFGPPGTGKTATLVELICQAIVCQPRLLVTLRSRVLVCATSNAAVDEITIRLLKYLPAEIMCRIYSQSYDRSKVNKTILPCSYFLKDYLGFIRTALHFQIILVTNITCACLLNTDLGRNLFSYVIIDEASQATEPETILPFLFGPLIPMMKSQVVLAGDPYQLGPVILSRIAKPLLGISMLERLMNFPMYKQDKDNNYDSRYVTKLKQNYRSHECILHVSNQEFYESELIACGDGRIINSAIGWSKLPNKYFPIIFHSSYGIEKSKKYSSSMYNLEEISIIMKYLNLLLGVTFGDIKIEQGHIGIVSPFKQQKLEIIERLKKRKMNSITVGSVEEFQGSEKEIIILTTVRSRVFNHDGIQNIGFLSEERRFNVALTRAKCLLIIIGNPTVLETNKHWKVLLEYCRKNNAFTKSFK